MRGLVFIEHNAVARHFLHNNTFDLLGSTHDIKYIFPEKNHRRISQLEPEALNLNGDFEHLPIPPHRQKIWKWLYLVDQLRWKPGAQARALRKLHRSGVGFKASLLLSLLGLPGVRKIFKSFSHNRLRSKPFKGLRALLEREKPDLLIHPCVLEGLFINDLIEESKRMGIPLVIIMNSWDNPSTKRAMVGTPDWLLVWGEQTFRHAVDFAGMPPERTVKFGAAQFEAHKQAPKMTRQEFCDINGIDRELPILVYAGSSKGTREIDHLLQLDMAIESGALPKMVILYRPHPWGNGGNGGREILKHNWKYVRIEHSMRGYMEQISIGSTEMSMADYRHTHELLTHCDALLSPLSTIILECIMHGKPALCFMPMEDTSNHFRHDSQLVHFQDMFKMPEILKAWGSDELIPKVRELIGRAENNDWEERLKKASNYFVKPHDDPYGKRLLNFTEKVISDDNRQ